MKRTKVAVLYYVAVVDPDRDFARRLGNSLQLGLDDYPVVAYESAESFVGAIQRRPLRVPLAVVADTAARTPTVDKGVFVRANRVVPRCRGIYYSTQPNLEDMKHMLHLGVLKGWYARTDSGSVSKLREAVRCAIDEYRESVDYLIVQRFAENMASTPHPEECAVEGVDDALSPMSMLIEMLRGTELGKEYLRNLLPLSLLGK